MDTAIVIEIGRDLLLTTMLLVAAPVGVSIAVGLIVSLFQTVTGVQEQTLTFAPRLAAVGIVMLLMLAWSLRVSVAFSERMLVHFLEASR